MLGKDQYTRQSWSLPSQKLKCADKYKTKIQSHRKVEEGTPDKRNHVSKIRQRWEAVCWGEGRTVKGSVRITTGELGERKIKLDG